MKQAEIDAQNAEFWDTLCGTSLARMLNIEDGSPQSLRKFDDWYLDYYPYLLSHVPVHGMGGKDVLEIGLGYGTLSQKIAEAGARYSGLDIASGPVEMVNSRLTQNALPGRAVQGSMLQCPFPDESFDCVVSIGCFHHTGDTQRCLDETYRVLRPGGHAYLMLYNRFSWRQWNDYPAKTLSAMTRELLGIRENPSSTEAQRAAYDTDTSGKAAPETQFYSVRQIHRMMSRYQSVSCTKENCDDEVRNGVVVRKRSEMLATRGRRYGLDIYIHAVK
ncbi:class I SAM-dependent methyltransferase [Ramlibacter tataouinensis]|uniref:class I SAM-dependent methyltransferase n=1 Tax=Ramlibacter tataouinensis TaxID=94132 RepID=UPI0022F3AAE3|nr:class I SAM-dependent methyltransferase [Ramlibacter tataouinensis]WBY00717.1 class I SAM-dependent methyltransferase [Ramlibacter tataouinensis]